MPSRDRQNQPRYDPYDDRNQDGEYEDVFSDEGWTDDDNYSSPPARRAQSSPSTADRMHVRPAVTSDGTAARIDRLRQAMRTSPEPTRPQTPQRSSRPAPGWRPDRPGRQTPPASTEWDEGYDDPYAPEAPARSSASNAPYPDDPYYVDDAQEWDDEYYGEYDDDFTEYDNPRPAPRSRPQITMPTLTVPRAITDAALVRDRTALVMIAVSIVGLVAMAIFSGNRMSGLEPGFATHVSASGVLEDIRSPRAIWNLTIMSTMLTLMAVVIAWFTAGIDRFASRMALGGAWLVQFIAWVALIRLIG